MSERVAIGKRIEALLGERRGRPSGKNVQNFAHFTQGTKTRDVAAEKAGFDNAESYRQAKQVVEQRAMVAARIANLPEGRPEKTSPIGLVSQMANGR